jgi:DNA-binding MarR family transcriptional regulator
MRKSARYEDTLIEVDHEDAILSTFILFVQTAQEVLKYADAHLHRKTHLSVAKLIVLQTLAGSGRAMTPSEIARWTNTERNNITALISRMKREGLVATEHDSSDRRFVNVEMTDKGREVLSRATPVAREVVNQVMSSMTEGDAALLKEKLRILRQNAHHGLARSQQSC